MTWTTFKSLIDKAIAEVGATGDVEIRYIEISNFGCDPLWCPEVTVRNGTLSVTE